MLSRYNKNEKSEKIARFFGMFQEGEMFHPIFIVKYKFKCDLGYKKKFQFVIDFILFTNNFLLFP